MSWKSCVNDPGQRFPKLKTGEADKFNDLPGGYKENVKSEEVPYDAIPDGARGLATGTSTRSSPS